MIPFCSIVLVSHILHLGPNSELSRCLCLQYSVFCVSGLFACMASFWSFAARALDPAQSTCSLEGNDTTIDL